ncbi:MAG: dephospho-CoA kinase [Bacteroidaceae bacterium]|nr:dephospho-CoA kinase [Bacteroidaceae bacterium]MBR1788081.1 dephospho-CoA kinase [Bacteroidaceae bacterium]
MLRLGITGGIGSGKSYVSRMLEQHYGIPVYNCDLHAQTITHTDSQVRERLEQLLPRLYDSEGGFDKARLAAYLFASDENARRVNSIIHPAVRRDLQAWYLRQASLPLVAVESAILYESGFDGEVDRVLFVDAPLEVRIQRTAERDGLRREQVVQRILRQHPEEAGRRADFQVVNDGRTPLDAQLSALLEALT